MGQPASFCVFCLLCVCVVLVVCFMCSGTVFYFKIWNRHRFKGNVAFYGALKTKGDALWVGVCWDDVSRGECNSFLITSIRSTSGKHDGSFDGDRYFHAAPRNGSFVHIEKLNFGLTFLNAVKQRVCLILNV